jgi:two-component system, chemotaxis family, protein-glutamate methylesterase/glutaminase
MSEIARDVILIGASSGGVQAIGKVLSELPWNFEGAVAVTLHRSPAQESMLAHILGSRSRLEVAEAKSGVLFQSGHVYLAPPDHHLVFASGLVLLDRGAKVNHARPSIDVMFRSGAENFGPRVVGIVLTGHLTDGVLGLGVIKSHGGISLAQEPAEALAPSMPLHAVAYDGVDVVFRLAAAGKVLEKLVAAKGVDAALTIAGTRRPRDEPSLSDA